MSTAKKQESLNAPVGLRPKVLVPTLQKMFEHCLPVMLVGKPGVGKTDMTEEAAKAAYEGAGMDLLVMHPVVSDPTDFKGMPFANNGRADFLPFGDLERMMTATVPTVAFLDDLGQAPPAVQAACMQLILARQINGKPISDFVTFAAATNRKADRAGVSGILEPVKSRFVSILNIQVHTEDWSKWAATHKMPVELISYINWKPQHLDDFQATAEITNSPCPRTVANVGRLLSMGMPAEAEFALIEGAAGMGFATEFSAYRKVCLNLPDPDAVLKDPKSCKLDPRQLDIVVALAFAVGDRVNKKNIGQFFKFMDVLPSKEYGVMALKMICSRDPDIEECNEFLSWQNKNLDWVV